MSKLDDILQVNFGDAKWSDEAKQQIKELFLEIINSTELLGPEHPQSGIYRQELRQKVEEL